MIRKAVATVAAFLLALLFLPSAPAQAASLHGCPDDTVCLYQWINYGADRWQSSFNNLMLHSLGCVNLTQPMAYWDNGTPVTDNSGSLVINNQNWGTAYYVSVFNWANCNSGGGISSYGFRVGDAAEPDLRNVPLGGGITAYHTITSIQLTAGSCPPGGC